MISEQDWCQYGTGSENPYINPDVATDYDNLTKGFPYVCYCGQRTHPCAGYTIFYCGACHKLYTFPTATLNNIEQTMKCHKCTKVISVKP